MNTNRREMLKRSAVGVAMGLVTPSYLLAQKLTGPTGPPVRWPDVVPNPTIMDEAKKAADSLAEKSKRNMATLADVAVFRAGLSNAFHEFDRIELTGAFDVKLRSPEFSESIKTFLGLPVIVGEPKYTPKGIATALPSLPAERLAAVDLAKKYGHHVVQEDILVKLQAAIDSDAGMRLTPASFPAPSPTTLPPSSCAELTEIQWYVSEIGLVSVYVGGWPVLVLMVAADSGLWWFRRSYCRATL